MKKNLFAIIMVAIVTCVMVTSPVKAEEKLMDMEKHLHVDPMCKYELSMMEKFEQLLPLASDGEYTLIDQHMDAHDDGTYDWTMRAYDHSLEQVVVDGAHFNDVLEIVLVGAEFESMLKNY